MIGGAMGRPTALLWPPYVLRKMWLYRNAIEQESLVRFRTNRKSRR